jgi:ketosteroid isomerase-like protein
MRNADVIRRHYEAFGRNDINAMLAGFTHDIIWTESASSPTPGTFVGPHAVRTEVLLRCGEFFSDLRMQISSMHECSDHIIVVGDYQAVPQSGHQPFRMRTVHLWTLRDGRIASFEEVTDTSNAYRAVRA